VHPAPLLFHNFTRHNDRYPAIRRAFELNRQTIPPRTTMPITAIMYGATFPQRTVRKLVELPAKLSKAVLSSNEAV
jgi:hypothetical protein